MFGYSTAMELEDVLFRIESRLKAVGLSAHAASLADIDYARAGRAIEAVLAPVPDISSVRKV